MIIGAGLFMCCSIRCVIAVRSLIRVGCAQR